MASQASLATPSAIASALKQGRLRMAVVGLGRIGLPTAAQFAMAGANVTGIDINPMVVESIRRGKAHFGDEPGLEEAVADAVSKGKLSATLDFRRAIPEADIIVISVPTPVNETKVPNYSAVKNASQAIGASLQKGSIVIVESTVGPGTVETLMQPILEEGSGMKAGTDFGLASCPERSDPGSILKNMSSVPRIVGALTPQCTDVVAELYHVAFGVEVVKLRDPKTANAVKLTENLFRDVNIALANEFALLFEKLGIDAIEVIDACATKYNFMPHYPGAGVGGPCLVGKEFVYLVDEEGLKVTRIADYVTRLLHSPEADIQELNGSTIIRPTKDIYSLSFDGKASRFQKVLWFSTRRFQGKVLSVALTSNRNVTVTPDHPMLVRTADGIIQKRADALTKMDEIPLSLGYPKIQSDTEEIDMIDELERSHKIPLDRIKVKFETLKLKNSLGDFSKALRDIGISKSRRSDYHRWNYMPLDVYLRLERETQVPLERAGLRLYTSRGSACLVPAVLKKDTEFWRLIGYYLSEGCMYDEQTRGGNIRTRIKISFSEEETWLIDDCKAILRRWGIKFDEETRDGSHSIRFSSKIFGALLESLGCGTDSYNKKLPRQIFFSSKEKVTSLLRGLFRGDGWLEEGTVRKSTVFGYATTSPDLFQGVLLLLQGIGLIPTCSQIISKKSTVPADRMRFSRFADLQLLERDVQGLEGLQASLLAHPKMIKKSPAIATYGSFATAFVKNVTESQFDGNVYNLEIEGSHTFVTSFGIVTHNCLPSNPYYLISEGVKVGNIPYLIRMAREINDRMPDHVVELAMEALNDVGRTVNGSKIAVLGASYKPNVKDVQLSPIERVCSRLQGMGAEISLYDPLFRDEVVFGIKAKVTVDDAVTGADCIIIGTAHDEFKRLDLNHLSGIASVPAALLDSRNVVDPRMVTKAGFKYRGVGRVDST